VNVVLIDDYMTKTYLYSASFKWWFCHRV